jgi:hypothetical protein
VQLGRLQESSAPTISIREAGILSSHEAMLINLRIVLQYLKWNTQRTLIWITKFGNKLNNADGVINYSAIYHLNQSRALMPKVWGHSVEISHSSSGHF